VAAVASVVFALPLIVYGTPDVESYILSIFSTIAFAREMAAGADPWFAPAYGFGVPLSTSTWLIRFPLAIPAALAGADWLYAVLWLVGEFVFAFYFLRLAMALTCRRWVALVLLATAMLSFSNLGTTYVDDWVEHFLGWAFLPACLWYVGQVLVNDSRNGRLKAAAACAFAMGLFTGSTHHNEMVTFYSGLAVMLAFLLPLRPKNVIAVGCAVAVALLTSLDVLVPAVRGMLTGGANPIAGSIASTHDAPTLASYGSFLEPILTFSLSGVATTESVYGRVPFFGLTALALALMGAVRVFRSRAPVGAVPNDLARALAVGFIAYSALTLLPPWVVLNLPRMWTYRDGQTVLGLLCAGIAIEALLPRWRRLMPPLLAVHVAQMCLVAAPIVYGVVGEDDPRLFGYAREERVFFDRLRELGVGADSRLMLAGELEGLVRGSLANVGVTAATDFALEGIPIVNAWYRGAGTPALGQASTEGRYGYYETIISWRDLQHLDRTGLDVLGITHVAVLERDLAALTFSGGLRTAGTFDLPGSRRVHVLSNDDAWSRAVLLGPGRIESPPQRSDCPTTTVYCRDYTGMSAQLQGQLNADWRGSSMRVTLPPEHGGGTILVSMTAGLRPLAVVDGESRPVTAMLDTFAAFDVRAGERDVELSVRWTPRVMLTVFGTILLLGCLAVAVAPARLFRTPPPAAVSLTLPIRTDDGLKSPAGATMTVASDP
jgi:hypothetical protein